MNDDVLAKLYRRTLERRGHGAGGDCPSPETLRAVVEREAGAEVRLRIMEHVAGCADCQRDLALLAQVADTRRHTPRRAPIWWLAAAASVVLAVLAGRALITRNGVEPVMRGEPPAVTLVSPSGSVPASTDLLVWHAVRQAVRYEVEVLGPGAQVVQATTVRDTVAPLPVGLQAGVEYQWRVSAVRADGTRLESALIRFALTRP